MSYWEMNRAVLEDEQGCVGRCVGLCWEMSMAVLGDE